MARPIAFKMTCCEPFSCSTVAFQGEYIKVRASFALVWSTSGLQPIKRYTYRTSKRLVAYEM